ncbi:MAG: VWA domain-containing protein [Candidatus Eisenbacteria bacterium]|nr:VWA domain-containing protein [Candidatus Eisenbacteria bacterium]
MRFSVSTYTLIVWLTTVPFVVAVIAVAVARRRRASARRAFAEAALMEQIAPGASPARQRLKGFLVVVAVLLLGLAAGRPQVGTKLGVVRREGVDLLLAVDVSASMRARDLKPDRLEKARREAASLIGMLDGDRVGLITFAGEAFVQCPLTVDYGAASMILSAIEPGTIPTPGTALADAIRTAVKAMETRPDRAKALVIMTDGEDHGSDVMDAARDAAEAGITVFTIGMGSTAGEPIPETAGEGYKRDRAGQIVMSKLNESVLIDVAAATGGRYFRATDTERELAAIEEEISAMQQGELESRMYAYYEERFQVPLALGLLVLALEIFIPDAVRRRKDPRRRQG